MRGLSRLLLLAGLLLIAGCSSLDSVIRGVYTTPNLRVTTASYDGVIFTMDNGADSGLDIFSGNPIGHYWTPAREDAADLESRLIPYLEQVIPEGDYRHGFWENLSTYKRQYVGVLKGSDPYIWANFFCVDDFSDWQNTLVMVEDGGNCFFNVWYDMTTHEFSDLQVNGFA